MTQIQVNHDDKLAAFLQTMGRKLYHVRKSRKESLKKVGEATSISRQTISRIEKGKYNPIVARLIRLCNYYGISLASLFDDY